MARRSLLELLRRRPQTVEQANAEITADYYDSVSRIMRKKARLVSQVDNPAPTASTNQAPMVWGGWARSSGDKYPGGLSKSIGGRIWNHWILRNQARDIIEDSPHAYTLVHRKADTVVDSGLHLEPSPNAQVLGLTLEETTEWAVNVAESFELWATSKKQHRAEKYNWHSTLHQLEVAETRENDIFLRLYYSQATDLLNPLQYEIIDPNQLRGDALTVTNIMSLKYPDGIVRDGRGRETKYLVWTIGNDPTPGKYYAVEIPRIGEKSGRVIMIHAFKPEYAGQQRGYSQFGISVQEFEEVEDYILSTVKKAINQSQMVGIVTNNQAMPTNIFETIGATPAGPNQQSQFGGTPVSGGVAVSGSIDAGSSVRITPMEEASLNVPGSMLITSAAQGDKLEFLQNTSPTPDFESFVDAVIGPLVNAHGMSMEMFKIKFDSSYSAARGALAVLWRLIEMERTWLDHNVVSTVYEMWLSGEIAAGRVSCPGWSDPRLRAAWCAHTLIGTPPIQIDPTKEADAAMKFLQVSATNVRRVAREHNGSSYEQNAEINRKAFPDMPIPPYENKQAQAAPITLQNAEESQPAPTDQKTILKNVNGSRPSQLKPVQPVRR